MITLMEAEGNVWYRWELYAEHASWWPQLWVTGNVMNSYTQSSHYSKSSNGPWNKIMMLMEKMMTSMKTRSLVMVFRSTYLVGEMRGGLGVEWRVEQCGLICIFQGWGSWGLPCGVFGLVQLLLLVQGICRAWSKSELNRHGCGNNSSLQSKFCS